MIIESRITTTTCNFGSIPVGDGFKFQDWFYMKISPINYKDYTGTRVITQIVDNAVQLETGELARFYDHDIVECVPMKVVAG